MARVVSVRGFVMELLLPLVAHLVDLIGQLCHILVGTALTALDDRQQALAGSQQTRVSCIGSLRGGTLLLFLLQALAVALFQTLECIQIVNSTVVGSRCREAQS